MRAKELWWAGTVGFVLVCGFCTAGVEIPISSLLYAGNPESGGGTISGHVYHVDEQPIAGATVEVTRMDPGGWWEATTESDGSYKVTGLPVLTYDYTVRAFKEGFAREYYDNVVFSNEASVIRVNARMKATDIDFYLNEGGSISGHVYEDGTQEPIEGARIRIVPSGEGNDAGFHTVTDPNGSYSIGCLALGSYNVRVEAIGFIKQQLDEDVKVTPPSNTPNIDFLLSRGGSISGYVYDASGNHVQGVVLEAQGVLPGGAKIQSSAETQSDGSYIMTGLLPLNNYRVSAVKPGFAPEWYDSQNTFHAANLVSVTEGNNTPDINFILDIAGSITGHVYDEEYQNPIVGILLGVELRNHEFVIGSRTNYDGSYTIWLRKESYLIIAEAAARGDKYVPEWYDNSYDVENAMVVNVTVPNETSGIDFYLAKAGSISGYIHNEEGAPISDASVYAFSAIFPGNGANSQSDGHYTIEGLPSGNYTVQVTVTNYFSEYKPHVVVHAPDNTPEIDLTLKKMPEQFIIEGFEKGHFGQLDWKHDGDAIWAITSKQKCFGTYSAQAGLIGDNETTSLKITHDCASGDITFYRKVSSESSLDCLKFYIDGVEQDSWSGERDWARVSFPVKAGRTTFTWTYSKDGSVSDGSDTAWIDDIVFPVP